MKRKRTLSSSPPLFFFDLQVNMGVTKQLVKEGDGVNFPKKGQTVVMHCKEKIESSF